MLKLIIIRDAMKSVNKDNSSPESELTLNRLLSASIMMTRLLMILALVQLLWTLYTTVLADIIDDVTQITLEDEAGKIRVANVEQTET